MSRRAARQFFTLFGTIGCVIGLLATQSGSGSTIENNWLPGFEYGNIGSDEWWANRWEFLADSDVPWIRTYAVMRRTQDAFGFDEQLYEEEYDQKYRALAALVGDAPPDLLSQVTVAQLCSGKLLETCREEGVFGRILAADPDNLEAYLYELVAIPLGRGETDQERAINTDGPSIRELVAKASEASHWTPYSESASMEWYRANHEFAKAHPPEDPAQADNPPHALAFWLADRAPLTAQGAAKLHIMCPHWIEQNQEEMSAACGRLARLLMDKHNSTGYLLEYSSRLHENPIDPEGLRLMRVADILNEFAECIEPVWIREPARWPSMDAATFERFVHVQARDGRHEAMLQGALSDFDSNPSRYPMNPADCEGLLQLDNLSLASRLGKNDPVTLWIDSQIYMAEEKAREQRHRIVSAAELVSLVEQIEFVDSVYDQVVKRHRPAGHARVAASDREALR